MPRWNPFARKKEAPAAQDAWNTQQAPLLNALHALHAAADEQAMLRSRVQFYHAVRDGVLLVPMRNDGDGPVSLHLGDEGVLPAFTDRDQLRHFFNDALNQAALMRATDLCAMALRNDMRRVVINPNGAPTYDLIGDELVALAQGQIPQPSLRSIAPPNAPMPKPDNSELQSALHAMYSDPATGRPQFFRALWRATLWVPMLDAFNDTMMILRNNDDKALAGFTATPLAAHFFGERNTACKPINGHVLCRVALEETQITHVVIDPGNAPSYALPRTEFEEMARGRVPGEPHYFFVDIETPIAIERAQQPLPPTALEQLRAAVAQPGVHEAWWFPLRVAGGPLGTGLAIHPTTLDAGQAVVRAVEPLHGVPAFGAFIALLGANEERQALVREHGNPLL